MFIQYTPSIQRWPGTGNAQTGKHLIYHVILSLVFFAARIGLAEGRLLPDDGLTAHEVVVVANSAFPDSLDLARYYLQKRGIPENQLLTTAMPTVETVERDIYERQIASPLKDFLVEENLGHVRCVVLIYGVPLRVTEPRQTPEDKIMERMILQDRETWLAELLEAGRQAQALAGDVSGPVAASPLAFDGNAPFDKEADRLGKAFLEDMRQAAQRIAEAPDTPSRAETEEVWRRLWTRQFGFNSPADRGVQGPAVTRVPGERKAGYNQRLIDLLRLPLSVESVREFLDLALESLGTAGAMRPGEKMRRRTHPDWQSRASVDSELCTLFWPDPPLERWVRNPLKSDATWTDAPRTLMVCRLDGPGESVVRRMIDDSLATEAEGLRGRVYLDSRGFDSAKNAYGRYDLDLQALGRSLDEKTTLGVTLDRTGELFQPGDCPDAALYCGWYKLGDYVDAFDFQRGAIAWHMASSEAMSLHKPGSRLWCPSLLADGAAATIGPVEEPYLTAFPLPSGFFALVMEGRHTLAECYFKTVPSLSWMMTLIGDPLYRPYAADPVDLR